MAYTLGIYREDKCWKIALLHLQKGKPQILYLKTLDDGENLLGVLQKKSYQIATALDAEDWILRELELEIKGWKNVLSILPFQIEETIPFPKEQAIIIPFLKEETKTSSKIRLVATKWDFLKAHITSMNEAGIEPHLVTTTVHALKRWVEFTLPQLDSVFLLYLHKEKGFVAFLQHHEIIEFKTIAFDHPGQWQRIKDYFLSFSDQTTNIPWVTVGDRLLLEMGDLPSQEIDPALFSHALPIGIALDAAHHDKNSVQFRSGEFEPHLLQKKKKKIVQLSLTLLIFSFLLFGPLGYGLLNKHRQSLVPRAQNALQQLGFQSREDDIEKLLHTLAMKKLELDQEKKFGSHFPMATWFLEQLHLASQGIEFTHLPQLNSLEYRLDTEGNPALHVQWICANKEVSKLIKHRLQRTKDLRIVKWKENAQICSLILEHL